MSDMDASILKNPYQMFGIECGEGWKPLYQPILDKVSELNREGDTIKILQVKEKFGCLDVSLSHYTAELLHMITDASDKSSSICEECGKPTKQRGVGGWIYTLCDECYDKLEKRMNEFFNNKCYEDI